MTRNFLPGAVLALLLSSLAVASAHEYVLGALKVVHPWSRATPHGATTAVAYMKLINGGATAMRLTGATSAAVQRVEIHEMSMDGGVMRMRPVQGLDIAPGATVELKPGGVHLMLIGLKRPIAQEDLIPVTLTFADGTALDIDVYVEAAGAGASVHDH
jgi:copper(I)-binding protein